MVKKTNEIFGNLRVKYLRTNRLYGNPVKAKVEENGKIYYKKFDGE
jgi:hypothetical protein